MPTWYEAALWFIVAFGAVAFVLLLVIPAPYGRHARPGWGPTLDVRVAWLLMESPAPLGFALVYLLAADGHAQAAPARLALVAAYLGHYGYRAFVYPFRIRGGQRRKPLLTALMGATFNTANGAANAFAIIALAPWLDDPAWLTDPRFLLGAALFVGGLVMNQRADAALRALRAPGERGYKIPRGPLYRWVSCPNYLGEIIEWTGFALAASTLPAAIFAAFTVANLLPRAVAHHRWYRAKFPDYPPERRALVPFVL